MSLFRICLGTMFCIEALAAVPLSDIPGRLQQTATIVRRANSHARPVGAIAEIERKLPRFRQGAHGLLATTEGLLKRRPSAGTTRELRNGWALIGKRLVGWQDLVRKRSASLQEDFDALDAETKAWGATLEEAAGQQIPSDLQSEIRRVMESIAAAEKGVLSRRNTILKLLGDLSRLGIDLEEMDERLSETMSEGRGMLLRIDAPALWQPETKPDDGGAGGEFKFESVEAAAEVTQYYLLNLLEFVGFELLVFAVLAAVFFRLKMEVERSRQAEDEPVQRLVLALQRPFSTAMLLTVVTGALWNSAAPEFLLSFGWYATLIPLCRVLPRLAAPGLAPFVWSLAGLFAADGLLAFLPPASFAGRILVMLLAGGAGLGLLAYKRRLRDVGLGHGWRRTGEAGIAMGVALLGVSVVSEAIGATALSRYLEGGVLRGIYAASALYCCFSILRGLVHLGFRAFNGRGLPAWKMSMNLQDTMVRGSMWLALALYLVLLLRAFQVWDPLLDWNARVLEHKVSIGALNFTLGSAFTFTAVLAAAAVLSRILRFIAAGLRERIDLQRGTSEAVSRLAHYAILTAGFLLALGASGIDLTKFNVLAGGLGVGVAFGMQNIVNNFVSGLILLFERPFHVGDKVTVGATSGEVADVGIRASVIRTWDGADVIIPNASLILGEVTNWTLSDDRRRGELRVGVAYGTDTARVIGALTETALGHPDVLRDPAPTVHFTGFGDSSLEFILRFWTKLEVHLETASQLHEAVYHRLARDGVEIPFPQREIRIRPANLPEVDSATR